MTKGLGNLSPVIIEVNYYLKQGYERPSSWLCKWECQGQWGGLNSYDSLKSLEKENDDLGSLNSHPS